MADERISAADVDFDDQGRAIITNPQTVSRLRAASGSAGAAAGGRTALPDEAALKNLGCCSVAVAGEFSELARNPQVAESLTRIQDELALKNIGCCSVTDIARDQGISPARIADELALKNVGCCSVTDIARDQGVSPARIADEAALKNIGCCSVTDLGSEVQSERGPGR